MRVLFVDDNAMNREVVKSMLESADVVMVEAEDGEHGLEMVEADHYDLILMDLRMPGMDGLAAIRAIRARRDAKAAVPIIVVTADADIAGEGDLDAFDGVVRKPIAPLEMYATIARATQWTDADDKEDTHAAVC